MNLSESKVQNGCLSTFSLMSTLIIQMESKTIPIFPKQGPVKSPGW